MAAYMTHDGGSRSIEWVWSIVVGIAILDRALFCSFLLQTWVANYSE